jgi:uncharacterized membrane protein
VTSIIGVIMAYVYRADVPEWVATHYRFQIRTFWTGLLYAFLSVLTAIIIVGFLFVPSPLSGGSFDPLRG